MTKKVKPIQELTLSESKRAYDELFSDVSYYIDTKIKARGIHDLIAHIFREKISGARALD